MTHLTCTVEHRVAVITLDNAPQNRIGDQMVDELVAAMKRVASSDARAVLLCAGGPDFSFGGGPELAVPIRNYCGVGQPQGWQAHVQFI